MTTLQEIAPNLPLVPLAEIARYDFGIDAAVDVIGGKWKPSILMALAEGPRRPGELRRGVRGISEKMLIQQLRQMEADWLVQRLAYPEVPPRVEYSLTSLGESLITALEPLAKWGEEHAQLLDVCRTSQESGTHP